MSNVSDAIQPQPTPIPAQGDVWAELIAGTRACNPADPLLPYMEARRQQGIDKYGVPLQRENGRDHHIDALQEALDGMVYALAGNDFDVGALFDEAARRIIAQLEGRTR